MIGFIDRREGINTINITSPLFKEVVNARIDYLFELLELSYKEIQQKIGTRKRIERDKRDIITFLDLVKDSVSIVEFIEHIAGGDMRTALKFLSSFLVSGNIKIQEILGKYRRQGFYDVARHQFLKAIILGDYRYYSSELSQIFEVANSVK